MVDKDANNCNIYHKFTDYGVHFYSSFDESLGISTRL